MSLAGVTKQMSQMSIVEMRRPSIQLAEKPAIQPLETINERPVSDHLRKQYLIAELRRKGAFDFVHAKALPAMWTYNLQPRKVQFLNFTGAEVRTLQNEAGRLEAKLEVQITNRGERRAIELPVLCLDDEPYTKIECMIFASLKIAQDVMTMKMYSLTSDPSKVIEGTLSSHLSAGQSSVVSAMLPVIPPLLAYSEVGFADDRELQTLVEATRLYHAEGAPTSYAIIDLQPLSIKLKRDLAAFIERKGGASLHPYDLSYALLRDRFLVLHSLDQQRYIPFLMQQDPQRTGDVSLDNIRFLLGVRNSQPTVEHLLVITPDGCARHLNGKPMIPFAKQNEVAIKRFYSLLEMDEIVWSEDLAGFPLYEISLASRAVPLKTIAAFDGPGQVSAAMRERYLISCIRHWSYFDFVRPTQDFQVVWTYGGEERKIRILNFSKAKISTSINEDKVVEMHVAEKDVTGQPIGTFSALSLDDPSFECVVLTYLRMGIEAQPKANVWSIQLTMLTRGLSRKPEASWNSNEKVQMSRDPEERQEFQSKYISTSVPGQAYSQVGFVDDLIFPKLVGNTRLYCAKNGASIAIIDLSGFPANWAYNIRKDLASFIETEDGSPARSSELTDARFLMLSSMDQKRYRPNSIPLSAVGDVSIDDLHLRLDVGEVVVEVLTRATECVVGDGLSFTRQDDAKVAAFYQQIEMGQIRWSFPQHMITHKQAMKFLLDDRMPASLYQQAAPSDIVLSYIYGEEKERAMKTGHEETDGIDRIPFRCPAHS